MDEKQLLTKLRAGEATAVHVWYKLYALRLEHFILGKISNPLDVQEIVQEVFMKSLQNLAHFTGKSTLWTWMCSIAKHEVADYWRKKYAKKTLALVPLMDNLLAADIGDAHDLAEKIGLILKKLDKGNGELLMQKYVDCKKVAQIAREMGKSSKAIESDLWRARQAFKKAYLELE